MTADRRVRLTVSFDVDLDSWQKDYGHLEGSALREDVRTQFEIELRDSEFAKRGAISNIKVT